MKKLLKAEYFKLWKSMLAIDIQAEFLALEQIQLEPHSFTFYTSVSVMSSSKIEGEQLEIDSYVKHKILNIEYLPELTEKPNDLYKAYLFAHENNLNQQNFLKTHQLITAAPTSLVNELYNQFWAEITLLLEKELSIEEVFYYAAFIHLAFVNIHPFSDGNGRISRLLEKWFLAEKLGQRAWYIKSEKYYYQNVNDYYKNLVRLGLFYEGLEYEKSIPFLLMLPNSLIFEK